MVDKRTQRIPVECPNGHRLMTRKLHDIQCRLCVLKGKYSRFDLPLKEENKVSEPINN